MNLWVRWKTSGGRLSSACFRVVENIPRSNVPLAKGDNFKVFRLASRQSPQLVVQKPEDHAEPEDVQEAVDAFLDVVDGTLEEYWLEA